MNMREILFRGKSVRTNEWVYGDLKHISNIFGVDLEVIIHDYIEDEVDKNTIGQYTGLTDKNGKKIFEGDIVQCKLIDRIKKNGKWVDKITYENYEVIYSKEDLGFRFKDEWKIIWKFENCELEVIGNIYDGDNK